MIIAMSPNENNHNQTPRCRHPYQQNPNPPQLPNDNNHQNHYKYNKHDNNKNLINHLSSLLSRSSSSSSTSSSSSKPLRSLLISYCLLLFINHLVFTVVESHDGDVFQMISSNPELSMFKEFVDKEPIFPLMLQTWPITVFAPNNQAMKAYLELNSDKFDQILFKYHIVGYVVTRENFLTTPIITSFQQAEPIFLSTLPESTGSGSGGNKGMDGKSYFANNAMVIEAYEDLIGNNNKQALFIIDQVLTRPGPNLPSNALELIKNQSEYGLKDVSLSKFLKQIENNKLESLFTAPGAYTYFIPSKISSDLDESVIKAHIVEGKALFSRAIEELHNYKTMAYGGDVDVELALLNKTIRFTQEKLLYIQSNTVKSNAIHKPGRVLSRLLQTNIPTKNGVVHIIEKPLMLMDLSVRDFLKEQPKLKRFTELLERHSDIIRDINGNPNKTILAPDDNAFVNLKDNNPNFANIGEDSEDMKKLLLQHVVYQQVSSNDLKKSGGYGNYTSASNVPVVFRLIGTEPKNRLTVESGGVNATSSMSDFGASDGIIHIIDRVLGMPFNTIYEKLINNPLLNETFQIGSRGGTQNWNSKLADQNKRYTFFAPSNEAWIQFSQENPSEYKQLSDGIYPMISRAILDRHLSAKGQYNKKDLEQIEKKVDTIQGELVVSPDPVTRDIFIEWEGKRAKIISSDIHGLNGVIHVIDQVLAKRRDFKVNSASTTYCHSFVIFSLLGLFFNFVIQQQQQFVLH